jgi:23S rRNA-/tRNA-specific pseudouridylate synthase
MASTPRRREPRRRPLTLLHEDARWVAVDKPPGVPVHGGAGKTGPSVLERLEGQLGARLHLVHRLDRGTGGALLLARRAEDARRASELWADVEKRYWAIAEGAPRPGLIDRPLPDPDGRARPARTELLRVHALGGLGVSLCLVRIATGRLHQIRRHLAGAGHPVLLDDRHGDFARNKAFAEEVREMGLPKPKHLFLVCASLRAPPDSGLPPRLAASWPRGWPPLLERGGLAVDDLSSLA